MPSSTSIIAPDARLRHGSLRAVLLIASVGTVATPEPHATVIISFPDHPLPPVTLTSQQGREKRHVTVRIAPQEQPFSGDVSVSASVDFPRPIACEARRECLWEADVEFEFEGTPPGRFELLQWEPRAKLHSSSGKKLPARDVFLTVAHR